MNLLEDISRKDRFVDLWEVVHSTDSHESGKRLPKMRRHTNPRMRDLVIFTEEFKGSTGEESLTLYDVIIRENESILPITLRIN